MNKKILALVIIILIVLATIIIAVSLNKKSEDKDEEGNKPVDIIYSLVADKTNVKPGDTLEVKFTLDKLPDNGYGVGAVNIRLAFDSSKLTLEKTVNSREEEIYYVFPGNVGENLGMHIGSAVVKKDENSNIQTISVSLAKASREANCDIGEVFTVRFKVNEGASGNAGLSIVKDESGNYDFATSGVTKDELGRKIVNDKSTYEINSNLEEVTIE